MSVANEAQHITIRGRIQQGSSGTSGQSIGILGRITESQAVGVTIRPILRKAIFAVTILWRH